MNEFHTSRKTVLIEFLCKCIVQLDTAGCLGHVFTLYISISTWVTCV